MSIQACAIQQNAKGLRGAQGSPDPARSPTGHGTSIDDDFDSGRRAKSIQRVFKRLRRNIQCHTHLRFARGRLAFGNIAWPGERKRHAHGAPDDSSKESCGT